MLTLKERMAQLSKRIVSLKKEIEKREQVLGLTRMIMHGTIHAAHEEPEKERKILPENPETERQEKEIAKLEYHLRQINAAIAQAERAQLESEALHEMDPDESLPELTLDEARAYARERQRECVALLDWVHKHAAGDRHRDLAPNLTETRLLTIDPSLLDEYALGEVVRGLQTFKESVLKKQAALK